MSCGFRIGQGYDIHRLVSDRPLIICGLHIPFDKGLDGWSDADVAVHAVMDALLGAAGLGDIGAHFPPGDERFHGADSMRLLAEVNKLLTEAGWQVGNIDCTVLAEAPKLKGYLAQMAANIAAALGADAAQVNIKAGTNEKLGYIGRGEGIAAQAVALIEKTG
jgi:2-C-methyl-D-erythritol 2,4-cyclodiphosphate synthase